MNKVLRSLYEGSEEGKGAELVKAIMYSSMIY